MLQVALRVNLNLRALFCSARETSAANRFPAAAAADVTQFLGPQTIYAMWIGCQLHGLMIDRNKTVHSSLYFSLTNLFQGWPAYQFCSLNCCCCPCS
jgi:hypothetical protein